MSLKPFFTTGATGSGFNVNVNTLSFNSLNTGFVYLGATGLANVKQIETDELSNSAITTAKIADSAVTTAKIANNINLSGIPTVDTATTGTNTTQIANTIFVQNAVANLVNSAPSTLDTLNEISNALGNDPNFSTTITNIILGKVSKTGNEEISGIKTFTVLPESSNTPTTNTQLTNKSYIDTQLQTIIFTQGITGTQGSQGAIGTQGTIGAQGITGLQGAAGLQGAIGTQGTIGAQGITGLQGEQGTQGITGLQGTQGTQGEQGTQGSQGFNGAIGVQGFNGVQGPQGLQSTQGAQGVRGAQGAQGNSGIIIADNNSNTTMYPVFISDVGTFSTLNIDASSNNLGPLTYNPSTGTLTCDAIQTGSPIFTTNTAQATSGQLGYIQNVTSSTSQTLTTGVLKNLGNITLAAGTWLVIFAPKFTRTGITYSGYQIEISTTSTAFNNNISSIKETFPGATSATSLSAYNTTGVFYSGSQGATYYGNVSCTFSGAGGTLTASSYIMQATRLA